MGVSSDEPKRFLVHECQKDKSKGVEDLIKALPATECRYVLYDHEYKTDDGRLTDKLIFLFWSPRACVNQEKMEYSTVKKSVRELVTGAIDLNAQTQTDVRDGILGRPDGDYLDSDEEDNDDNCDWMDD